MVKQGIMQGHRWSVPRVAGSIADHLMRSLRELKLPPPVEAACLESLDAVNHMAGESQYEAAAGQVRDFAGTLQTAIEEGQIGREEGERLLEVAERLTDLLE